MRPRPSAQRSTSDPVAFGVEHAVASTAIRSRRADHDAPPAINPLMTRAMPPHAFGDAIEVPFMSWREWRR